jgi:hypothetical protein
MSKNAIKYFGIILYFTHVFNVVMLCLHYLSDFQPLEDFNDTLAAHALPFER